MTTLIELQRVSRKYLDGQVLALNDVSLSVERGEFVSITGRSGCGKSTLLNLLGGLDRPTSGEIFFDGRPLSEIGNLDRWRAEKVGFVFQSFYLLPNLTAEENVQLPLFGKSSTDRERVDEAGRLLSLVGLSDRRDHLPSQLSIGQCQRVALARAFANRPSVLLADEPTGSLDSQSGKEVLDLIEICRRNDNLTVVMVTHDSELAARAERIIRMHDGKIVEDSKSVGDRKMEPAGD